MNLEVAIKPRTVALFLGIVAIYLAAQSLFGEYINTTVLQGRFGTVPALILDEFSVNAEQTIPTWFQVLLLFVISVLLALIARAKWSARDRFAAYWTALAVIFLYLSMDEAAAIHEIFADPLQNAFHSSGVLAFGWQILAAPLVIIFGLVFLRFLFHLPPRTRNLFILAGVLYVGGALVIDGISASVLPSDSELTLEYLAIGTIEELFEMAGMVVFIYTLLAYMTEMGYGLLIRPHVAESQPGATISPEPSVKPSGLLSRSRQLGRLAVIAVVLIVGMNAALVYWAVTQDSPSAAVASDSSSVYQAIIDQFPETGLVVTHLNGPFDAEHLASRQLAASLLAAFKQVMVVTLPATHEAIFVAGETLPFDRSALSDVVRSTGETQFVIFDTPAVRQVVGSIQPPK